MWNVEHAKRDELLLRLKIPQKKTKKHARIVTRVPEEQVGT